jgi:hypothetical protein
MGADASTPIFMAPKITIHGLMLVVAISAIFAWLLRTNDWLAVAGIALAAFAVTLAVKSRTWTNFPRLATMAPFSLILIASGLSWFSMVDRSVWWECCQDCGDHRHVEGLRIVGIPIVTTQSSFHTDTVSLIRRDLGMPCTHDFARTQLARAWGLTIWARPCGGITCCLSDDGEYYNDDVRARVRQYAASNPTEACELGNRIVNDNDFVAMHAFIATMKNGE